MDIFFFCPIPDDQKPINEYLELKESSSSSWVAKSEKIYKESLNSIFFTILIVEILINLILNFNQLYNSANGEILFFHFNSYSSLNSFFIHFLSSLINFLFFAFIFLLLVIFFHFFRWLELNKRLKKARLFYEEGSWYDGKIWNKPLSLIKNEKLLSFQKVEPVLQRLFNTILLFLIFIIILRFGLAN